MQRRLPEIIDDLYESWGLDDTQRDSLKSEGFYLQYFEDSKGNRICEKISGICFAVNCASLELLGYYLSSLYHNSEEEILSLLSGITQGDSESTYSIFGYAMSANYGFIPQLFDAVAANVSHETLRKLLVNSCTSPSKDVGNWSSNFFAKSRSK